MPTFTFIDYKYKLNKDHFLKYDMLKENGIVEKYETLKNAINYKTHRTIQIGGKTYNTLYNEHKYDYMFLDKLYNDKNFIDNGADEYIKNKAIEKDNENKRYRDYRIIIDRIKRLEDWNDYVEYEGINYGLPHIIDGKHKYNNCNGNIIELKNEKYYKECSYCRNDRPFCTSYCKCYTKEIYHVKCGKCNYEHKYEI